MGTERFSRRHGFRPTSVEITVRDGAPRALREAIPQIAVDLGLPPSVQREILCGILRVFPDEASWSEYPNIWSEVHQLILDCDWYYVYDYIEALFDRFTSFDQDKAGQFAEEVNGSFEEKGIGWLLRDDRIEFRGSESFEATVGTAKEATADARPTANAEIHEALLDLSRRPEPDLTGAIHHAMAALECIARDIAGEPSATLGNILRRHPDLIPEPLDTALSKIWGFASERGRHVREGQQLDLEEAELVVGIAAAAVTYLAKKHAQD